MTFPVTKHEFERIKKTKRWTVTFEDFYSRYFIVLFPLGITLLGYVVTVGGFKDNLTDLKFTGIVIFTIGLFLTFFFSKRLYQNQVFESHYFKGLTNDKIDSALKKSKLNNVKYYKLGYFQGTTNVSWFSWGELVTIIPDNDKLLINSRPTGSAISFQPITIFKDRKNIKTVINELTVEGDTKINK